ncbi:MAG: DUF1156 domain-containing protein [Proteobacteria bacterium]|nr:DUF1156 domain-containing protein [Pseudomonadota bacterium]
MSEESYPRRLIEVDLPISEISEHSRREKSTGQKHISTMHTWWARRPLGACRAVACAAMWIDPADPASSNEYRKKVANILNTFAAKAVERAGLRKLIGRSLTVWSDIVSIPLSGTDGLRCRKAMLRLIADFAQWQAASSPEFKQTSQALTHAASKECENPEIFLSTIDPFAGGGAFPLEAQRIGGRSFSSDLNPVAVLLARLLLDYAPRFGEQLSREARKWGLTIEDECRPVLNGVYPALNDEKTVAYVWARTAFCEGPGCGLRIPLIRSLWLAKVRGRKVALRYTITNDVVDFHVVESPSTVQNGTVKRGSAICPRCNFTTSAERVRAQFIERGGGASDAKLLAVVTSRPGSRGRVYRPPTKEDLKAVDTARIQLEKLLSDSPGLTKPIETLPYLRSIFNIHLLGVDRWHKLFSDRQLLALLTICQKIGEVRNRIRHEYPGEPDLQKAIVTILGLALDKLADSNTSICRWRPTSQDIGNTFARQALGIVWDFAEINVFSGSTRDWMKSVDGCVNALQLAHDVPAAALVEMTSATEPLLPDDSVGLLLTDPPYYDSVPYADLSDFFYVWLKRSLAQDHPDLFASELLTPKEAEIVQLAERNDKYSYKTKENYEQLMTKALEQARRTVAPHGVGVVVFAHKQTDAWETQLNAMLRAGWVITSSWPIDTEKGSRLRALGAAALASSIHLVCRPRENSDGTLRIDDVGDWRSVLQELPERIHAWMPRLATEGIVGADAIFACLGPALEIFSRYARVEKTSGDIVHLREYLEHVWAAVAREALAMIFESADTTGLEADARLSAMWLWTLSISNKANSAKDSGIVLDDLHATKGDGTQTTSAFVLEYDAARKIAQGLGVHLENLKHVVQVKGHEARLLPVVDRMRYLFGAKPTTTTAMKATKNKQMSLFADLNDVAAQQGWSGVGALSAGETTLDRVHQGMLLFAAGRGEALKRFLVNDGVGHQAQFWKLAQSLSALYPMGTDEKRWVDGVLSRKKGLGFG